MASRINQPREDVRTRAILDWINKQPRMRAVKFHGNAYTNRGEPDIFASIRGQYWAFEVKRSEKEEPSEVQKQRIREIRDTGARAYVVTTLDDVKLLISRGTRHDDTPN